MFILRSSRDYMFLRIVKFPFSSEMQSYFRPMKSKEEATVSKIEYEHGYSPPFSSSTLNTSIIRLYNIAYILPSEGSHLISTGSLSCSVKSYLVNSFFISIYSSSPASSSSGIFSPSDSYSFCFCLSPSSSSSGVKQTFRLKVQRAFIKFQSLRTRF